MRRPLRQRPRLYVFATFISWRKSVARDHSLYQAADPEENEHISSSALQCGWLEQWHESVPGSDEADLYRKTYRHGSGLAADNVRRESQSRLLVEFDERDHVRHGKARTPGPVVNSE